MAKAAAKKTAPAGEKPARKPKTPGLSPRDKFTLLKHIEAADAQCPDASIAKAASEQFGRLIGASTIADYRKQLGLASVPRPSASDLQKYLDYLLVNYRQQIGEPPTMAAVLAADGACYTATGSDNPSTAS